jgi:AraC-like DNA-binding protein/mannose-6-phosphate isomerase-like protein (cupin superfamily)
VGVLASPAKVEAVPVAMRAGSPVRAGAWPEDALELVTPWHTHELHQLLYAFEGVAQVETEDARHLLPPQQAAWIPAGLPHQTTLRHVRSVAVFFEPAMVAARGDRVRVLSAAAPVREMIVYAMRWPIDRPASDPTADAFFAALALLATEWLDAVEAPLCLPTSRAPTIRAVMAYTQDHLAEVTASAVSGATGLSERSLRRQFPAATGMSWQQYRTTSRVLRAMTILAEGDRSVLDAATEVGFDSLSGFNRAFKRLTGEQPGQYRRRVQASDFTVP